MLYKPEACACPPLLLSAVRLKPDSVKAGKSKVVKMFDGAFFALLLEQEPLLLCTLRVQSVKLR